MGILTDFDVFIVGNLRFLVELLVGSVLDQIEVVNANERLATKERELGVTGFLTLGKSAGDYLERGLELVYLLVERIRLHILVLLHLGQMRAVFQNIRSAFVNQTPSVAKHK